MGDWTPLVGGNVNRVARREGVVRRELSAGSGAVHQLLRHLERGNVRLVPRLLESDGRYEYLGFLPGRAVFRPWPKAVLGEAWLRDLGRWLRTYHGAVRGFRAADASFA